MIDKKRLLKTFIELVNINSPSKNEKTLVSYIKNIFKNKAVIYEDNAAKKIGGTSGNVIIRFKANKKHIPPIAFLSHLDTVRPTSGLRLIRRKNILSTDGTTILGADDKVGIAAMIELGKLLLEDSISHGDITLIFTVAEEIGLYGSRQLDLKRIKSDHTYVLDSAEMDVGGVVTKAPSLEKIYIEIKGKAAHSGVEPDQGINALSIASKALSSIKAGKVNKETTVNFGVIHGGHATNIVPDCIEIEGEVRSHNARLLRNKVKEIKRIFENVSRQYGGKVMLKTYREFESFNLTHSPTVDFVKRADKSIGLPFHTLSSGGGSDANILNALGHHAVVLNIGIIGAHTVNEKVPIENINRLTMLILAIAKVISDK